MSKKAKQIRELKAQVDALEERVSDIATQSLLTKITVFLGKRHLSDADIIILSKAAENYAGS